MLPLTLGWAWLLLAAARPCYLNLWVRILLGLVGLSSQEPAVCCARLLPLCFSLTPVYCASNSRSTYPNPAPAPRPGHSGYPSRATLTDTDTCLTGRACCLPAFRAHPGRGTALQLSVPLLVGLQAGFSVAGVCVGEVQGGVGWQWLVGPGLRCTSIPLALLSLSPGAVSSFVF